MPPTVDLSKEQKSQMEDLGLALALHHFSLRELQGVKACVEDVCQASLTLYSADCALSHSYASDSV